MIDLDCKKSETLIKDAFLEPGFRAEKFLNNELTDKELFLHLQSCSFCKELLEDLLEIKKSLDETMPVAIPPKEYFLQLIKGKHQEKELTIKETVLFMGVGLGVMGLTYLGIQFDFLMQFFGITSFLALLLTIYAFIFEKEARG